MRLFYLAVVFFYSCSNDPQLITEFIAKEDLPIEQIEHSEILHTEKGILKIKIIANTINRFKDIQPQLVFSRLHAHQNHKKHQPIFSSDNIYLV